MTEASLDGVGAPRLSDELWAHVEALLPASKQSQQRRRIGRPPMNPRRAFEGILYVLRTGCQWHALPRFYGPPSTVHDTFQRWARAGVCRKFWQVGLRRYDELVGIDWSWQSMDGAMTKAPLGGGKTGRNPTERGKLGVKRSMLTDARGVALGVAIDRHAVRRGNSR